jgi:UDP-galactopyranose mutase
MKHERGRVVAKVGRELYELFFRGYTRKQWERDPSELHASVCARIPIRTGTDDRYFSDTFQRCPPRATRRCSSACSTHRGAHGHRLEDVRDEVEYDHLVYTGPIDEFFGHVSAAALPLARVRGISQPTPDGALAQPVAP